MTRWKVVKHYYVAIPPKWVAYPTVGGVAVYLGTLPALFDTWQGALKYALRKAKTGAER